MRQEQLTANFVRTEDGVVKLLRSLGPLLASQSKSREQVLDSAKALHEGVSEDVAQLPEVQLRQADLLREYSRLYIKLGNPEQARRSAEDARKIVAGWVRNRPDDLQLKLRLVECENTLGDAMLGERGSAALEAALERRTKEEFEQAIATYERGLALARDLLRTHSGNPLCVEAVFAALGNLGDVQTRLGNLGNLQTRTRHYESALTSYHDAGQLIESLREVDPDNPDLTERLAQSEDQIGDFFFQRRAGDDLRQARQRFEHSLKLRSDLIASATEQTSLIRQSNLAFSHNKLGKAHGREGRRDQALTHYKKAVDLREEVVKADPKNFEAKRQLAYSYHNMATMHKGSWERPDDLRKAIGYFEQRLKLSKELYDEDPSNEDWEIDYGEALNALADALMLSNATKARWPDAETLAREAVRLTEAKNPRFLRTFARGLRLTGHVDEGRANLERAATLLKRQPEMTQALEEVAREVATESTAFDKLKPQGAIAKGRR